MIALQTSCDEERTNSLIKTVYSHNFESSLDKLIFITLPFLK
jgi:hypothetical protein